MKKKPTGCPTKRCCGYGFYWMDIDCPIEPFPVIITKNNKNASIPCPDCKNSFNPYGFKYSDKPGKQIK